MQIKAIDPIRATDQGRDLILEPGDIVTVSDEFAKMAIGYGWAEDPTGNIQTGERPTGVVEVNAQNVSTQQ